MDFTFTPEQDALREQARAFLSSNPEPSWQELAELGWTGVSIAEDDGGAGLTFVEEAVLLEELGRALSQLVKTGVPGPEGSISKLVWSEANQRVTKLALELLGPDAALAEDNAPYGGYWQYQQLRSRGNTIEAGTSEVLRNIVAERVLGLPKSR